MQKFIVQVMPDMFLATIENKKQLVLTPFLSQAAHLPFDFASEVCRTMQARGEQHILIVEGVVGMRLPRVILVFAHEV